MLISLILSCQSQNHRRFGRRTTTIVEPQEELQDEECINDEDHFTVWGNALSPVCYSCHNTQGAASNSDLVLVSNALPGYLEANRETLSYVASLNIDGTSLILRKPLGMDNHGGGTVLTEDSPAFTALSEFVHRLDNPVEECPGDDIAQTETHLLLASPTDSLKDFLVFTWLYTTSRSQTARPKRRRRELRTR